MSDKLSQSQLETLVAILNEDKKDLLVAAGLSYMYYNANTLKALRRRKLIAWKDTGVMSATGKTVKKLVITQTGKDAAFKFLGLE